METIKSIIGLGSTQQEGREPVNGVTGSGVGGEPYDQGNVEEPTLGGKAAQHADPITDSSNNPSISSTGPYTIGGGLGSAGLTSSDAVTPNAASATSTSGPAVDPTSSNTTSGPHSSDLANKADPRVDSDNDRNTSSGGIGSSSWMSTALPHRDVKNITSSNESSSKSSASAGSGTTTQKSEPSAQGTGLEDIKSQPPNNLPDKVPTGTSTDFVVSGSTPSATTGASSAAAAGSIPSSSTNTTADAMHAHQDIPTENVDSSTLSTSQPSHPVEGHRGSIVNPDAIPTAGGKKIGEDAYVERKSMQADSIDPGLPTAAATSANTTRNVGTAEATGTPSTFEHGLEHEKKSSVTSGSSETEHKEKKGLTEKIKNKLHIHKH